MTTEPSDSRDLPPNTTRRSWLEMFVAMLLAIPVLGPALLAAWVVIRPGKRADPIEVMALPLAEIPSDGVRTFRVQYRRQHGAFVEDVERVVYLRRKGNNVIALSAECTHLGCNVHFDAANKKFACPCHKGTFDLDGAVLGGPPPAQLRRLKAIVPTDAAAPVRLEI